MKLQFKFSLINLIAFIIMGGLFYWLCPLPANPAWRGVVCTLVGLVLVGVCFVVVSHQSLIRQGAQKDLYKKKHKHKK